MCEVGNVRLTPKLTLENVLYLPDFRHNLLFVSKLIEGNNIRVKFDECGCIFQYPCTDEELGHGEKEYGLYRFQEGMRRTEEKKERSEG